MQLPHNILRVGPVFAAVLIAIAGFTLAGPINPPAGPVSSTMKTLVEVEPRTAINAANTPGDNDATASVYKITQPGSYYLTGNFNVPAEKTGIEIAAENVTIDLNGFVITGEPSSNDGISVNFNTSSARGIVIHDGTIVNMHGSGIRLRFSNAQEPQNSRIERMIVRGTYLGIDIQDGIVRDCEVTDNDYAGISINGPASVIDSCVSRANEGYGIFATNATVTRCSASNDSTGIVCYIGLVKDCSVSNCNRGIEVGDAGLIECVVRNIANIGLYKNGGQAIIRGNFAHCTSSINTYGIFITGSGVRVEQNNIVGATRAIYAGGSNNFIVSNTFDSCVTAIQSQAGNRVGPILMGTSSPAINGNTGGGLGTSDPYANIVY